MRIVPNLREYKESLEMSDELINVLHQKFLDEQPIELLLTFKQPEEGNEPGEVQSIENLTDDREFTMDDLSDADMEQIKYLFKDALLSFLSIKNGLGVDEFPEFEPEGIDDPLLAPEVEDYDPNQLAVGTEVEKEHTNYEDAAQKIAKHHLAEDPKYYTKLIDSGLVDEETALKLAKILNIDESISLEIINFVKRESWFQHDENDTLMFSSREYGSVYDEEPGQADLDEGRRLAKLIKEKFGVTCELEIVDEWVILTVNIDMNESVGPNTEIFITDLGMSHTIKNVNGADFAIPRFGVWSVKPSRKPNVIETSDNLEGLLSKYKLTENDVIKLIPEN